MNFNFYFKRKLYAEQGIDTWGVLGRKYEFVHFRNYSFGAWHGNRNHWRTAMSHVGRGLSLLKKRPNWISRFDNIDMLIHIILVIYSIVFIVILPNFVLCHHYLFVHRWLTFVLKLEFEYKINKYPVIFNFVFLFLDFVA